MAIKQYTYLDPATSGLRIDGIEASKLAEKYGTPLLVTSERRLNENFSALQNAFKSSYENFAIKYAVKANSNPVIIGLLSRMGSGIDASSIAEIDFATAAGVKADKIMLSPNYASTEELQYALNRNITINFDDIAQFTALAKSGTPKVVSFRLNPGFGSGEFPGIVTGGPSAKFGIPESHIMQAYEAAVDSGVKRFGIHMMCGSNVLDTQFFQSTTSKMLEIAGSIAENLGIKFEFIDIGGGLGVPYRLGEAPLDIAKVAKSVAKIFKDRCGELGLGTPQLVVEPGRYLVADTTVLLGRVNHVKSYTKTFIGTDISMNLLLRPALYNAYHEILLASRPKAKPTIRADVVGEICENTDAIAHDRELPEMHAGDLIAVLTAGAYVYGMSSQYNGRPRPAEVLITTQGKDMLIRRRETPADLIDTVVLDRLRRST